MAKYEEYTLESGKKVRIPNEEIDRIVKGLEVDREEAKLIWLEDEGYIENAEQMALDKKAKDSKITATIHEAKAEKPKAQRKKVERKPDENKENLIKQLAETLESIADNVEIINIGKLISFELNGEKFELDLKRKRVPKK